MQTHLLPSRCAIFCIADSEIPPSVLDDLVEETIHTQLEDIILKSCPIILEDSFALMTSTEVSANHHELSTPIQPFTSPFKGYTIEEVATWFEQHIGHDETNGFNKGTFIVLESEAVEDGICTIVDIQEEMVQKLRCDFPLAYKTVCNVESNEYMSDSTQGSFCRSGVAMTKDNYDLAMYHGRYLDGYEVKIDPAWEHFHEW